MNAPVPLEDPPPILTSLTLLELITTVKVGLCPTMRTEQPGRNPYGTELDVSLLVIHAARGMGGSTGKSIRSQFKFSQLRHLNPTDRDHVSA